MSPEDVTPSKWVGACQSNKPDLSFWAWDERVQGVSPFRSGGCFRPGDDFLDIRSSYLELLGREPSGQTDRLRHRPPEADPEPGLVDLPRGVARIDRSHIHTLSLTRT